MFVTLRQEEGGGVLTRILHLKRLKPSSNIHRYITGWESETCPPALRCYMHNCWAFLPTQCEKTTFGTDDCLTSGSNCAVVSKTNV